MKIKHLIMVSLMLAILTLGAVSASQDIAADDELAADDAGVEIEQTPADDVIEESEDSQQVLEFEPDDFNVQINSSVDLSDGNSVVVNFTAPAGANGDVEIYLDDEDWPSHSLSFQETESPQYCTVSIDDLSIYDPGTFNVKVVYSSYDSNPDIILKTGTFTVIKTVTVNQFNPYWTDYIDNNWDSVLEIWSFPIGGTLEVYVDGNKRYNATFDEYNYVDINPSDLNITDNGDYFVSARYITDYQVIDLGNVTLTREIDYSYDLYVSVTSDTNVLYEDDVIVAIDDTDDYVGGTIYIYVDGALKLTKTISASQKTTYVSFSLKDLKATDLALGRHKVKAVYMKDNDADQHIVEKSVNLYAEPIFNSYPVISYGEKAQFVINHVKGFKGTATLYNAVGEYHDEKGSVYATASFVNGVATIYLTSLPEGFNNFLLNITGYNLESPIEVEVVKNTPGISAAIPTAVEVGNSATLKLTGPKDLNQGFDITVDGVSQGSLNFFNLGAISKSIKFTTTGTHVIKVFSQGSSFYSNTFYITVKAKSAPKIVKKATTIVAKKATFKAKKVKKYTITLKSGKAVVKKVTVSLKVKGKTYKALTNAKGKAVFKIKNLKKKGKYTAVIKFAGNKYYKASTKKVKLIVKK